MNHADQKKTVLLVDDAPDNIQIVNSILKDMYKIRIATNGTQALTLAKVTPPPDIILLDVLMPDRYMSMRRQGDLMLVLWTTSISPSPPRS
jgi:sigma-B regulation protein RsbU (phosphoserine phosphatase)